MTPQTNTNTPTTCDESHATKNTVSQEPFVITIRSPKVPDKLYRVSEDFFGLRPWYVEAWSVINVTGVPCGVAHVIRDSNDWTYRMKRIHVDPVAEHDAIRDALYFACRFGWHELDDSELQFCDPSWLAQARRMADAAIAAKNRTSGQR